MQLDTFWDLEVLNHMIRLTRETAHAVPGVDVFTYLEVPTI